MTWGAYKSFSLSHTPTPLPGHNFKYLHPPCTKLDLSPNPNHPTNTFLKQFMIYYRAVFEKLCLIPVCKQTSEWNVYIILHSKLILKYISSCVKDKHTSIMSDFTFNILFRKFELFFLAHFNTFSLPSLSLHLCMHEQSTSLPSGLPCWW